MKIWKIVCITYFQLGVNVIGLPIGIKHYQWDSINIRSSKYHG